MAKPIRVRLTKATDDWPKGAELGYASEAQASKALGEHYAVVSHVDTSEYVAPERVTDGPSTETVDEPKGKKG
jgi:hypothetical protein